MSTPIANVAAYVDLARRRGHPDVLDSALDATGTGRVLLRVTDLVAVLERMRTLCDDCVACESCGAWLCSSCGVGSQIDCDCDIYHCADNPWCWGQACMDAHRDDEAADTEREARFQTSTETSS